MSNNLGLKINNLGTLQVGTGATTLGGTLGVTDVATFSNDIAVNGGDITTNQTTFNLIQTTATTLNIGGAATALTLGATSGTLTLRNSTVKVDNDLEVDGGDIKVGSTWFINDNSGTCTLKNIDAES